MDPSIFFAQFMSGLARAMILFLIASGLSLIFGVLQVLNFAHGSLYMLGAFITYSLWRVILVPAVGFYIATILAALILGLIGLIIEVFLLRRIYSRGWADQLLATYAIILILTDIVKWGWGGRFYSVSRPEHLSGAVSLFGSILPLYYVFMISIGIAIIVGLWLLIYRTRIGDIIRASVSDREMVSALGIRVSVLFTGIFILGSFLAGLSGGVAAPIGSISLGMDIEIIVECFAVVVIGGMGSLPGTLIGSLIVGEVYAFGILVAPRMALAFVFIVMAVVLIVRPWGILGRPER
ncbi:MAG: branched-chain amino acid ABC transporter permease [Thermodesulfobacteriota bacterium]